MIRMIDLFAGIGGIRMAFESNGAKCVASSEIDKYACKTYEDNYGEKPLGDITKISSSELPDFDILGAGFPCQPFSIAGLRKGFEDTRGTLFFEVARILKDKKPKAFLLENVEGIVNHNHGKTLDTIETVLRELGYTFNWKVMNACDYGVPQNRKRWYCIGFHKNTQIGFDHTKKYKKIFSFPPKKDLGFYIDDILEKRVDKQYDISPICKKNIDKYINSFKDSERYSTDHVLIANEVRASRCHFRCDGISPCLTAKMGTGGNNIPIVVAEKRKLTEKECLRLMGFPEHFTIRNNHMQSYKQIGNSVVVTVVEALAGEMMKVLKG